MKWFYYCHIYIYIYKRPVSRLAPTPPWRAHYLDDLIIVLCGVAAVAKGDWLSEEY